VLEEHRCFEACHAPWVELIHGATTTEEIRVQALNDESKTNVVSYSVVIDQNVRITAAVSTSMSVEPH